DVVFQRLSLATRMRSVIQPLSNLEFRRVRSDREFETVAQQAAAGEQDVLYWPAAITSRSVECVEQVIKTLVLAGEDARLFLDVAAHVVFFHRGGDGLRVLRAAESLSDERSAFVHVPAPAALVNLANYRECLLFFSGSSEPRFFNQIRVSEHEVIKSSRNVEKMRAEHDFYYLLPPSFRHWFVAPFSFQEESGEGRYFMERMYVPDMAVQWVHESLGREEFDVFVKDAVRFLAARPMRLAKAPELRAAADQQFQRKVEERFALLTQDPRSEKLEKLIQGGTRFDGFSAVLREYLALYASRAPILSKLPGLVIGHGDPCLSNILYQKSIQLLRLVDPLGASSEEQLWHHPYYDWAKLSHSILGDYDWINNDLYNVDVAQGNKMTLTIQVEDRDGLEAKKRAFVAIAAEAGIDPFVLRLCEASLFLSMAPLHLDHERKVLAFILRGVSILEELKING
ncbi:MAG: hypothetical protein M3Y03_07260, partial [Verrucomicrobiota bacterium]|nr:hypothetical protein [Verrucomicrobiota bacterium]